MDKYSRMVIDKFENLKKCINFPCKLGQIGIVNVANTQYNILFGHSAPQAVKNTKIKDRANNGN